MRRSILTFGPQDEVRVFLDHDDTGLFVTGVRVLNDTDRPCRVEVVRPGDRRKYSNVFAGRSDTTFPVPTALPDRVVLQQLGSRWSGVDVCGVWPYEP
jgi:hypothetical protein